MARHHINIADQYDVIIDAGKEDDMLVSDIRPGEPDLLAGHEHDAFEIRALAGHVLAIVPAVEPWTHVRLVDAVADRQTLLDEAGGADFYLGSQFVGGTEV